MSATDKAKGYKTLAIRLDDDTHAQLSMIAKLRETSIAAEIQQAIESHLQAMRSDKQLSGRAAQVLECIDTEAKQRRDAVARLFDDKPDETKGVRSRSTRS